MSLLLAGVGPILQRPDRQHRSWIQQGRVAGQFVFIVFCVSADVARNERFRAVFAFSASTRLVVQGRLFRSTIE